MGSDTTLEKALYKAFEASYLPTFGNVVFTIADDSEKKPWTWLVVSKYWLWNPRDRRTAAFFDHGLQVTC